MFAFSLYCLDGETCVLTVLLRFAPELPQQECIVHTLEAGSSRWMYCRLSLQCLLGFWRQWWEGLTGFLECLMKVEPSWINYLPKACAFTPPLLLWNMVSFGSVWHQTSCLLTLLAKRIGVSHCAWQSPAWLLQILAYKLVFLLWSCDVILRLAQVSTVPLLWLLAHTIFLSWLVSWVVGWLVGFRSAQA